MQQVVNANYGGFAISVDASNFVQTVDGTTTAFYGVNVSTSGDCIAFGGDSGSTPFLTMNRTGDEGSISATVPGQASFDGGMTFTAGTLTIDATASSSDPLRHPTMLSGTLRHSNTVAEKIQISQFVHPADGGSITVLFDGAPCASGALDNGSLTLTDQRSNGRIKN